VSALVRDFLQRIVHEETPFDRMQGRQNDIVARIVESRAGISASERLRRDEVHERHAVR
jgi:antitoxin component of RelBE/YafQ-DinJ toxin-antitoxin module